MFTNVKDNKKVLGKLLIDFVPIHRDGVIRHKVYISQYLILCLLYYLEYVDSDYVLLLLWDINNNVFVNKFSIE